MVSTSSCLNMIINKFAKKEEAKRVHIYIPTKVTIIIKHFEIYRFANRYLKIAVKSVNL